MAVISFDDLIPGSEPAPRQRTPQGEAISSIESGGRYDLLGPVTRHGDRAHGKYQVMGENVGPWTEEVLGRRMTPQEFLASPQAQDAVFEAKFGQYSRKYGPEGAARAWFAGEGGMNDMGRRDQLGTSVGEYERRFRGAMGSQQQSPGTAVEAVTRAAGGDQAMPSEAMALAPQGSGGGDPQRRSGAISFDDLIPDGGQFAAPPAGGGNFRAAREGVSETYQPMGRAEAFGRGAMQGLTAGFGDELSGVLAAGQAGGPPQGTGGRIAEAVQGAVAPFVGGRGVLNAATGAGRMLYERATGDNGQATQAYDRAVAEQRAEQEKAERDRPGYELAGNFLGGAALPAGAAARGAGLGARMARGALTGAAYGGLTGAGTGEDATERAVGAAAGTGLGAIIGGAAPAAIAGVAQAGRGVRALASPITNTIRAIRDPQGEAARVITGGIQSDVRAGTAGLPPAEFQAARDAGTPVNLMELGGERTRAIARSAANVSPEARGDLTTALQGRFGTQGDRVIDWLNRTFHYPNAQAQQAAIDDVERTVNRGAYNRAQMVSDANHPGGIWSPELEGLTSARAVQEAMQEAAQRGSNRAVSEGVRGFNPGVTFDGGVMQFRRGPGGAPTYPDLRFWDLTQRNLRQAATVAARAGRDEEAGAVTELRRQLLQQIDAAVPEFRTARQGAAQIFGAEDALQAGQNFVASKMGNREARVALSRMSPQERQLFQDGFVSRYVQSIAEVDDRRNVLNKIGQSPASRERLNMVLGRQRANELEALLRVEGLMQTANQAVSGNSMTARYLAEYGLSSGVGGYGYLNSDPNALLNTALVYGAARGKRGIDTRVAREVGRMLTSQDPAVLARGLRIVGRQGRFLDSLRAADQALARGGAGQAESMGAAQIPQAMGIGRAQDDQQQVPRR